MRFYVLDKSIVGYKNIIKNKSSQDYLKVESTSQWLICTIADGHSGEFFTESHKGSRFACEASINIMKKYINENMDNMKTLLKNKIIQQEINNEWRVLVKSDIIENSPKVFKDNYLKYGTTLLTVLIKEDYILYIKLGDGDILINKNNQIEKVLPSYKNNIVDCIAQERSYEKVIYRIEKNEKKISDIIMFSDGFENSFLLYDDLIENINDTIIKYKKSVFSKYVLEDSYDKYLIKLSENKSYDDISIVFINILR